MINKIENKLFFYFEDGARWSIVNFSLFVLTKCKYRLMSILTHFWIQNFNIIYQPKCERYCYVKKFVSNLRRNMVATIITSLLYAWSHLQKEIFMEIRESSSSLL